MSRGGLTASFCSELTIVSFDPTVGQLIERVIAMRKKWSIALMAAALCFFYAFADDVATKQVGAQFDFTTEYERLINEYNKYLSSVPKSVKEEELNYLSEISKLDKEIAKLNYQKIALRSKLSEALREHQETKSVFDKKLYMLSKKSSHKGKKAQGKGRRAPANR